ncbi:coiled-coil domain-containing protein 15 isoform X1 [Dromiciops gliroides]|uniref:coiled-coil domain-containing protein 15 isoform X1 n=1 Tax=Dromiciops gliroides TaxID=33562 RepID=UPI001CC40A07|nr:coiled-coil domain-containing protein 15 isoform X1 [Dromiciops gliroides]
MAVPGLQQLSLIKGGIRAPPPGRAVLCPGPSGRRHPPVLTKHSAVFARVQESRKSQNQAPTRKSRCAPWVEQTFEKNRALLAVLAERNEAVAPVGAWVECASPCSEEAPASVSASQLEEELKEQQRLKEEALKRFQEQVKNRVNQQMRLRKKQQLQKSYEAAEKESIIAMQSSDSAPHLTPKSSKSIYQSSLKSAIRSTGPSLLSTQTLGDMEEEEKDENGTFQQQALTLSQTVKQARQQLASRKTTDGEKPLGLSEDSTESSPTQEKTYFGQLSSISDDEKGTEKPLPNYLPGKIQDQDTKEKTSSGMKTDINREPAEGTEEEGEPQRVHGVPQSGLKSELQHLPSFEYGIDQEEDKKERQKQYLRYRRLFMDIEREQVKELEKQRELRKKIERIKKWKEQQRCIEEQRILRMTYQENLYSGEKTCEILADLQLEDKRGAAIKKQQRNRECIRYIEALRAQIQEKMRLHNIDLPPLCCCGSDFWDAHPDTCANNCIFYKNHQAYTQALHSVISSCEISESNSSMRLAIHSFASACRRNWKIL